MTSSSTRSPRAVGSGKPPAIRRHGRPWILARGGLAVGALVLCTAQARTHAEILAGRSLLSDPKVQAFVRLSPIQRRAVAEAIRKAETAVREEEARRFSAEAISHEGKVLQAARLDLEAVRLSRDQVTRLAAATLRNWGPLVVQVPGVASALGLSADQLLRIDRGLRACDERWRRNVAAYVRRAHPRMIGMKGGESWPIRSAQTDQLEVERDRARWRAVKAVLTHAQRAELTRLTMQPLP